MATASSGVDIVVNRLARRLEAAGRGTLRDAIVDSAGSARVHETRSLAELEDVARAIARTGTSAVVLAGGDGSYMAGVTALARAFALAELPALALAPGGTVSTVARNWAPWPAWSGEKEAAKRLVRAVVSGAARTTRRPSLRVTDGAGGDRVGFIFGAGLVASFFDAYYASPKQGYAGAASIVARIFTESFVGGAFAKKILEPTPARLEVDGAAQSPRAWSLVVASVVKDLGLHMWVTHRAAEETDAFHLVASALPPRALGPQMPRVLAGRVLRGEGHVDTLAREATLTFERDASAYVLDGERIAAPSVTVRAGPVLRVLTAR